MRSWRQLLYSLHPEVSTLSPRHMHMMTERDHREVRWTLAHKGRFADRLTAPIPGLRHKWHLLRDGHIKPKPDETARLLPSAASSPLPPAPATGIRLTWVGHASFVVQAGGLNLLVDPVWSNHLTGGVPRIVKPGLDWEHLPKVDGVLISHNHYDHLDKPTILRLPKSTPIVCPLGMARWFEKRGFTDVRELDWYTATHIREVAIDFVPAHHWSRRGLFDTNDSLWGGYVISPPDGRRIFFSGDTAYGRFFKEIGARYPGIEAAIMGIGSYAPRWYNAGSHATPEEAVQATHDLGARLLVPMHWGTFRLSPEPVWEPVERVLHAWAATGRPWDDLWLMRHGERRETGMAREHPILEVPAVAVRRRPVAVRAPTPSPVAA